MFCFFRTSIDKYLLKKQNIEDFKFLADKEIDFNR